MVNFHQGGLLGVVTEWKVMMIDKYNFTVADTNNLHEIWYKNVWLFFFFFWYSFHHDLNVAGQKDYEILPSMPQTQYSVV